jgi:hypothetical protein
MLGAVIVKLAENLMLIIRLHVVTKAKKGWSSICSGSVFQTPEGAF